MKKLIDGAKNTVLYHCGDIGANGSKLIISLEELSGRPKSVRLEGLLYALEREAVLTSGDVQIPIAGRGKFNFEEFHALPLDKDIYLDGSGKFFIMLDMEKL